MFYVTGDIHGGMDIHKLSARNFPEGRTLTRDDYVIICGDFGLPFLPSDTLPKEEPISNPYYRSDREEYWYWIKWLAEKPFTVLWVDGNHDNHPFWKKQKKENWNGGKVHVHPLADNVIHLLRGEYYDIGGTTFWAMGGASSHDRERRTEGLDWWPQEVPNKTEMDHGIGILEQHGWKVDYIITHAMPQHLVEQTFLSSYLPDPTSKYLEYICENAQYKHWYCGHYHMEKEFEKEKVRILYDDIIRTTDD